MALQSPIYKMVLVGEGGVAKTSITVRYTENRFDEQMKMTIGVNFAFKEVFLEDSSVRLMLWDLGGQSRFRDVVSGYFKGARVVLAVYDANRYFSLERFTDWISRAKENAPDCQLIFVGNNIDERHNGQGMPLDEGQEFAAKYGAAYVEVSAKTGESISELFEVVARSLASEN